MFWTERYSAITQKHLIDLFNTSLIRIISFQALQKNIALSVIHFFEILIHKVLSSEIIPDLLTLLPVKVGVGSIRR